MRSRQLEHTIRSHLDSMWVIDSHDHTEAADSVRLANGSSLFGTIGRSFIKNDLLNTGAIEANWKAAESQGMEGWLGLKRLIGLCRNTGYFRCFLVAVRDLLDISVEELRDDNWEEVAHAFQQARQDKNWYRYVLRTRGKIDIVLWDQMYGEPEWMTFDNSLFAPLKRFDHFADVANPTYRGDCLRNCGVNLTTFADLLDIIDMDFRKSVSEGIVGVKIAAAYFRGLRFMACSRGEASRIFTTSPDDISYRELLSCQDFIYSHVIERAISYDLPVQIHTGMQSSTGFLHNGYPLYLEELLGRYPKARFVLLHGAYPFTAHAATLALRHPNVCLDGSWLPILSPSAYRRALSEWLDVLPVERLIAWGGDAMKVEMTYGSLVMAKDVAASLFAERVERGDFSEDRAIHILERIFRENIREIFKTDEVRDKRQKRQSLVSRQVA